MLENIDKHLGFITEALVEGTYLSAKRLTMYLLTLNVHSLYLLSELTVVSFPSGDIADDSSRDVQRDELHLDRIHIAVDAEYGEQIIYIQHRLCHQHEAALFELVLCDH